MNIFQRKGARYGTMHQSTGPQQQHFLLFSVLYTASESMQLKPTPNTQLKQFTQLNAAYVTQHGCENLGDGVVVNGRFNPLQKLVLKSAKCIIINSFGQF